ncbi:MAG: 30S ribosomal protein S18 [Armatimonadetes bacterium]|nr:30S ribosomal protein S18 [Armatimonadota bacterium]
MDQEQTTPAQAAYTPAAPRPERTAGQDRPSGPNRVRKEDDEGQGFRKNFSVGGGKDARGRGRRRRKVSYLTLNKISTLDYKDIGLLRRFVNEQGKIVSPRQTGATAKEQRMIATAIKRAREMALMPFVALDSSIGDRGRGGFERRGGYRGGGGGGGGGGYQRPENREQQAPAPRIEAPAPPAETPAE